MKNRGIKGPYSGSTQPPGSHHQTTRVAAYGKLAGTVGGSYPCCSTTAGLFLSPHPAGGIYLVQHGESEQRSELIFSKTRLAPTTRTTIPRLELLAVHIGVRCIKFVKSQLKLTGEHTYLFTDCQCVLKWISSTKQLSVFITNRIKEIKGQTELTFHYIDTKINPADAASHSCSLQNLIDSSLRWHGPNWLLEKKTCKWPLEIENCETNAKVEKDFMSEVKMNKEIAQFSGNNDITNEVNLLESVTYPVSAPFEIEIDNYFNITKVFRITAFVLRFIQRLRGIIVATPILTEQEIEKA